MSEKIVSEDSKMQIWLIEGKIETCNVNEWDESSNGKLFIIDRKDTKTLIPVSSIIKIVFLKTYENSNDMQKSSTEAGKQDV